MEGHIAGLPSATSTDQQPASESEWARALAQRLDERAHSMAGSFAFLEASNAIQKAEEDARQWRARAEAAENRLIDVLPLASASATACEEMLARLAQAKSLAELSDLSRMIYELRTSMMAIEEGARSERAPSKSPGKSPGGRRAPTAGRRAQTQQSQQSQSSPERSRRASGIRTPGSTTREPPRQQSAAPSPPPMPTASWATQDALASLGYQPPALANMQQQQQQQQQQQTPWGSAPMSQPMGGFGNPYAVQYAASPQWWHSQPHPGLQQLQAQQLFGQQMPHLQQQPSPYGTAS